MEKEYLKRLIKLAEEQIDLVERPARSTSVKLLDVARDYLWLLNQPPNNANGTDACNHEWETMSGKMDFVEKCVVCGEERR